ncbi:MAG: Bug family tripartite tricarboxylate transporter substrate binding protein [Hyphomicrobiaceae bacterium]
MHTVSRRAALAGLAFLALWPGPAGAQEQTLKIVFPFAAGGSSDAVARMLADHMQKSLGRAAIVENRPGAGGRIGLRAVKEAAPDGATLLFGGGGAITIQPHVYPNLGYDPLVDLLPITQVAKFDLALAVSGKLPVRSLPELLAWLKANPEQATFGSPGAGAGWHFLGVELGRLAKVDLRHVPYKGTPAALPDLMTGRLPMYITTVPELIEHHKSGSIRILATASASRSRFLPDVPTLRESGFDLVAPNWVAMYAPAGTPATVAERLRAAILDALRNAEIRARIETLAYEVTGTTGEELARIQRADYERWGPIIKASGFKADQ